jgi:hypothetical protein
MCAGEHLDVMLLTELERIRTPLPPSSKTYFSSFVRPGYLVCASVDRFIVRQYRVSSNLLDSKLHSDHLRVIHTVITTEVLFGIVHQ